MFQEKYSLKFQVIFGIVCGILNRLLVLAFVPKLPLYLDTVFTVSASFFGYPCGLISIIAFHLFSITVMLEEFQVSTMFFSICSVSMVVIIRLCLKKMRQIGIVEIIILTLLLSFVVAVEGGLIYVFVFQQFNYQEESQVKYFTYALLKQNLSLISSSILPRIPVNLIDKGFSVIVGYLFAWGADTARERLRRPKEEGSE